MVKICIVKGCRKEYYPGCGKSYHKFPDNDDLKALWITALKLDSNVPKNACVCGFHFRDEDYTTITKIKLKPAAVPSILPMILDSTQDIVLNYKDMEIVCPGRSADIEMNARTVQPGQVGSSIKREYVEIIGEPPTKKLKPKTETNTQNQAIKKMRRKVKLREYIKDLKEKLKQRDAEIVNLKEIIHIMVEKKKYW